MRGGGRGRGKCKEEEEETKREGVSEGRGSKISWYFYFLDFILPKEELLQVYQTL